MRGSRAIGWWLAACGSTWGGAWGAGVCAGQGLEIAPRGTEAAEPSPAAPAGRPRPDARPEATRRVVRVFDFETPDPAAPELPPGWYRAQHDPPARERPGYPLDNLARMDFESPAAAGAGSVRLPTGGGSASLRLDERAAPALSGADYLVEAQVRTDGLAHAHAFLVARLLREDGTPIPGTEVESAPTRSQRWKRVSVLLTGDEPEAAFIQIDLELRQPEQFQRATLGEHQVWPEDFSGHASFDDVIISQFPRIEIRTTSPANIALASEQPMLNVLVRDLTGERISVRIVVQDVAGDIVATHEQPLAPGRGQMRWSPALPGLGWYRATLEVLGRGRIVGSSYVDFIWAPDPSRHTASSGRAGRLAEGSFGSAVASADRVRFGLIATDLPRPMRPEFGELVRRSGVGAVSVPMWGGAPAPGAEAEQVAAEFAPVIEALSLEWQDITLALVNVDSLEETTAEDDHAANPEQDRVHAEAAAGSAGSPAPGEGAAAPGSAWALGREGGSLRAALLAFLERYGQSISRWQVGQLAGQEVELSLDHNVVSRLGAARRAIAEVTPSPSVVALWRADHDLAPLRAALDESGGPGGVIVSMPSHWPEQAVRELAEDWDALEPDPTCELTLAMTSDRVEDFGRVHAVGAVVRRMLALWQATDGEARAALVDPWTWVGDRRGQAMPSAQLAAWRALVDRLADRRIVGEYPLGSGVRCLILAAVETAPESRGGALALWAEPGAEVGPALSLYLGDGHPHVVDVFGNISPLAPRTDAHSGGAAAYDITVGPTPVFVEDVDTELLSFLASLRVTPQFLETSSLEHRLELIGQNPWAVGVSGRLFVRSPGGQLADGARDRSWRIAPRTADFDIEPGGEVRLPIVAAFGPGEPSGDKSLELEVDIDARTSYRRLTVAVPFEVGLRDFALDLSWRHGSGTGDVVVEAQISNTSGRALSLDVACFAPGYARQSATVASLPPGATVTRHFVLAGGLDRLSGEEAVVTVSETQSGGRLNGAVGF